MTAIDARALICHQDRRFELCPVRLPAPGPDQVAIRTAYSGVSIGTEFALIRGKLSWGPYPLCTGYMGTGVVEAVGEQVEGLAVGDEVYYRGNDAMALADGTRVSPVSGAHCSHIVTRPHTSHGVAPMVPGAAMDVACMFVMPAVGLAGVDMANPRMGDTVVVHGCGLIGLGVVAACSHRGCRVVAIDLDAEALQVARRFGADHTIDASRQDVGEAVRALAPEGADVVFEATGLPACVDAAIALCRPHGAFVWQGNYGSEPLSMHFLPPHGKRLRFFFPCDDGLQACRRAVVKNMAMGVLPWQETITHRVGHEEAPAVFRRILGGEPGLRGVVIDWQGA